MTLREARNLCTLTAAKWSEHNAPRLSAALAYYSMLSLAPVVVLVIAIYGLAFNRSVAEERLLSQAQNIFGPAGVNAIKALTDNLHQAQYGIPAAIIAALVVFLGASSVFSELRDSLNTIWDVPEKSTPFKSMVLRRMVSVGLVLALGILLLLSLFVGAALQVVHHMVVQYLPPASVFWGELANLLLSFAATAGLFALIFKVVPDVAIDWKDVGLGAVATALLFTVGRMLLGIYLAKAAVGSAYGAAGSLVAFVVWVYYSAQIFFFGAIMTRVYASRFGSKPGEGPSYFTTSS